MMEDIELLAILCLSLAFETTLSYGYWRQNQSSEKIRQYLVNPLIDHIYKIENNFSCH